MSSMNLYRLVEGPEGKRATDEVLARGWEWLHVAASLLRLCERERGDALHRLLVDEIEVRDGDGAMLMRAAQMRRVVDLLAGIEDRIAAITTRDEELTDEQAIEGLALDPPVAGRNRDDDGAAGYNLSNALSQALTVRRFLARALQMGAVVALE